jgi:PhnB protein
MSAPYKPERYTSVAPYLLVDDAARVIDFLIGVFGAEKLRVHAAADGRLQHAEVRIDDMVVMLADSLEGYPALPSHVHVYVRDVDATFKKALAAGATPVQEPVKKEDSDKRGGFRDPGRITWWVGQQIE